MNDSLIMKALKCKTLGVNTAHAWKITRFSEGAMAMASPMHVDITDSIVSDVCKVRVSKMISTCIMYVVQAPTIEYRTLVARLSVFITLGRHSQAHSLQGRLTVDCTAI